MDISLYFERCGSGEPLILLHGNGEDHTIFDGILPYLKTHFTVYALDTRGHGKSPVGTAPFTLAQFAKDLKAFMDKHGIARAHLLGFSDGANIAMLFSQDCPERLLSLVLNSGNLEPSGLVLWLTEEFKTRLNEIKNSTSPQECHEAALLRLMLEEPHIDPASLHAIRVPTLVIAGDDDLIPPAHTRLIAQSIPGAKLVFLHGTHGVVQESPEAFSAALGSFYGFLS